MRGEGPLIRLALAPRECLEALSVLPGCYWLRDGERAFASALPRAVSTSIDPEPLWELRADRGGPAFPRWVGVLPYEGFRQVEGSANLTADQRPEAIVSRCRWQRYAAAVVFEDSGVRVVGETPADARELASALERVRSSGPTPTFEALESPEPDAAHVVRIRQALERIRAGQLYQVNLARRLRLRALGDPISLLARLGADERALDLGGARFGFALDLGDVSCVSLSPELFLSLDTDHTVRTSPIKGTRPRSPSPQTDEALARELEANEKERAELTMVIDLERNDLARVAETGSVRLSDAPRVVTHPTVHHREATVAATVRPGTSREQILRAMLPSGSVTGAPKRAAMLAIAELESHRRGLYTGALGYLGQDGGLRLSMAIRALTIQDGVAEYFVGGGIVADSDPEREVEETRWKAAQLAEVLACRFA